jgi:3-hydroxy-3-methylglutaryl CoA synthase
MEEIEVLESWRKIKRYMKTREGRRTRIEYEMMLPTLLTPQMRCAERHIEHIFELRLDSNLEDCDGCTLHIPNSRIFLFAAQTLWSKVTQYRRRGRVRPSLKI